MRPAIVGLVIAASALALTACGTTSSNGTTTASASASRTSASHASTPLKIAFIYNQSVNDGGWNTVQDAGRKALQSEFGNKVETTFKENVPETPQATQVIDSLVQGGAKLIFATSFGYHQYIALAAKQYPDVKFAQFDSTELGSNLTEYTLDPSASWYLAGMALGALSKTGKIGTIEPFPIPQDLINVNSFTLGVRKVNPKATVKVTFIASFFDPAKEGLAASAMISSGVDAIGSDMGDPAVATVANKKGVPWVGSVIDQRTFGPKTFVTSSLYNWLPIESKITKSVLGGSFKPESLIMGMKDGATDVAAWGDAFNRVSARVKSQIDAKRQAFKDGTESPFDGPVDDQSGKQRVAAGETLSPAKVQQMDYLVDGTIGTT